MADDPIASLATGLAEDHKAEKRARARKSAAAQAGDQAAQDAEESGSTEPEAAALGTVVENAVEAATDDAQEPGGDGDGDDDRPSPIAERIENIAQDADIDTRTLVGDVRDTMIDLFKTRPKPWAAMAEDDQRQVAAALEHAAKHLVSAAVQLIRNAGDGSFMAKLEKYADGGGLKINLTAESTTDNVLACHAAQGQFVIVSRYDPKPFNGERSPVHTDPDEPEMTFEGDNGDATTVPPADDSDLADPFGGDGDPDPAGKQAEAE